MKRFFSPGPRLALLLVAMQAFPAIALADLPSLSNIVLCSSNSTYAASDGSNYCAGPADTTYNITIEKVGFKRTDGQIFWFGSEKTVNVAAGAVGSTIGSYLNGVVLPNGTYTELHAVVKMSQTVQSSSTFTHPAIGTCNAGSATASRGYDNSETCTVLGVAAPYENNITATQGCVDPGTGLNYAGASLSPNIVITSPATAYTLHYNFDVSRGVAYKVTAGPVCTMVGPGKMTPSFSVTQ